MEVQGKTSFGIFEERKREASVSWEMLSVKKSKVVSVLKRTSFLSKGIGNEEKNKTP